MCGVANGGVALLYAPDGSTTWSFTQAGFTPASADVTNAVGRCIGGIGSGSYYGIGVLAFQVQ